MLRSFLRCLLLIGSACLTVLTGRSLCRDQPIEGPASNASSAQSLSVATPSKRPVTVADSIQMTRLGDSSYTAGLPSKGLVAKFSPDGKQFVVILKKGNLEANTNEYSLVLFQTAETFQSPAPQVLVSLASSSNRPAIDNVLWLGDNDTILFLGERPGEQTALYSLKCSSKELKKLTNHATNLTAFVSAASGEKVVFSTVSPVSTLLTASVARNGIAVTSESLTNLIRGSVGGQEGDFDGLWIEQLGTGTESKLTISGTIGGGAPAMSLSPDGAYLLLQSMAPRIENAWHQYDDKFLQAAMDRSTGTQGSGSYVGQYELVNMTTRESQVLVDAPIGADYGSDMIWATDSKSVVVSNIHLPLNVEDGPELALRKAHTFLVEIKIPSREFVKISDEDLKLVNWDPKTGYVACDIGQFDSGEGKPTPKAYFHKTSETWSRSAAPEPAAAAPQPNIVLEEDMNTPPHIVAVDPASGRKSTLMDLNLQFQDIALARVEEITWKAGHGRKLKGGLYWPPDYVPGKKYPLILQTHAWLDNRFWMDGPWSTAFAAQSLAGKGFFVLQVGELTKRELLDWHIVETFNEATLAMAAYDGAIDDLDRKGLIDRNRVGIIGFSRTLWYVVYTLAHSKHTFAAAAVVDGVDFSYFQYMLSSVGDAEFERVHGGPPFGEKLSQWLRQSPEFLMDKIETPLRIQTLNPDSLLSDWHWYTGLSLLGKPVEMIYIPDGTHILEKPWERMTSQQGDVDWFCFWLKGEEDPDPAKDEQYKRWRALRRLKH
jgi:dipeptidyl aminopeptidase/acylaminoacyl peptidase